jgi:hypothetical protein
MAHLRLVTNGGEAPTRENRDMRCTPIDPTGDQTWQDDAPSHPSRVPMGSGRFSLPGREITEADIDDVLAWTDEHIGDGSASVWLVQHRADSVRHIRLRGIDPATPADTWPNRTTR